jgi:colanic acid biosynthesis glycosyl transferase WcaI
LLSRLKRARLIFNVADLWPKAAVDMGVITNRVLIHSAEWLEEFLYRKAELVTSQTQGMADDISRRVPRAEVRLLTNGADLSRFDVKQTAPDGYDGFGLEGRFVVGYAGIHGPAQALLKVIEAAGQLKEYPEIVFAFFGEGPVKAQLQERAREMGLENVKFFPLQPSEIMPGLLSKWAVGLVPLYNSDLMRAALPSKMFEIMAAGIPVLLSAPGGEASAIIEAAKGGVCIEPESPEQLAAAVVRLYRDGEWRQRLGLSGRAYVGQHYSRQAIAERFLEYLLRLDAAKPTAVESLSL